MGTVLIGLWFSPFVFTKYIIYICFKMIYHFHKFKTEGWQKNKRKNKESYFSLYIAGNQLFLHFCFANLLIDFLIIMKTSIMSLNPFGLYIIYADLWNLFLSSFHLFVIPFLYHVWSMKNYIFFMNHMVSLSIIHHSCCWLQDEEVIGTNASEKLKLFNHNSFMHGGDGDWLVPLVAVDRHIMAYIWWAWLEQKQISCNAQSNDQYY